VFPASPRSARPGVSCRANSYYSGSHRWKSARRAELFSLADSTHDALNNATHRTSAATITLFLERLRRDQDLSPIGVSEKL
jgi:hypothetical protein